MLDCRTTYEASRFQETLLYRVTSSLAGIDALIP